MVVFGVGHVLFDWFPGIWPGQREAHDEGCTFPGLGFKSDGSPVLVHDHGARDGQALAGSFADAFSGKKGFENPGRISSGMPHPVSRLHCPDGRSQEPFGKWAMLDSLVRILLSKKAGTNYDKRSSKPDFKADYDYERH